jgi:hypothetical protein
MPFDSLQQHVAATSALPSQLAAPALATPLQRLRVGPPEPTHTLQRDTDDRLRNVRGSLPRQRLEPLWCPGPA